MHTILDLENSLVNLQHPLDHTLQKLTTQNQLDMRISTSYITCLIAELAKTAAQLELQKMIANTSFFELLVRAAGGQDGQ